MVRLARRFEDLSSRGVEVRVSAGESPSAGSDQKGRPLREPGRFRQVELLPMRVEEEQLAVLDQAVLEGFRVFDPTAT